MRKKELVSFTLIVLWLSVFCLFLTVPWVGLHTMSVAFPCHRYFYKYICNSYTMDMVCPRVRGDNPQALASGFSRTNG